MLKIIATAVTALIIGGAAVGGATYYMTANATTVAEVAEFDPPSCRELLQLTIKRNADEDMKKEAMRKFMTIERTPEKKPQW